MRLSWRFVKENGGGEDDLTDNTTFDFVSSVIDDAFDFRFFVQFHVIFFTASATSARVERNVISYMWRIV